MDQHRAEPYQDDASLAAALSQAMAAPWYVLHFPKRLEVRYRAEGKADRMRYQRQIGLVGIVAFISFLVTDAKILPDVWKLAVLLRCGGAALGLFLLTLLNPRMPSWVADAVMSTFALASAVVLVILFLATNSPDKSVYFDGLIVVVTAGNLGLQQRFHWVVGGCLAVLALALVAIANSHVAAAVWHVQIANLVTAIVLTVAITHRLSRQRRQAYLLGIRDALRKEELQRSNAALLDLSALDGLTGLANRRTVDRHLQTAWASCAASGVPIAVIMLDVDWFKSFNDTYGHPAGDACLLAIAGALAQVVRTPSDLAGRYGGEEFILILQGADRQGAVLVAERVFAALQALSIPHSGSPACGMVTASLGIGCATPAQGGTAADLLRAADEALYAAKQAGRARMLVRELSDI